MLGNQICGAASPLCRAVVVARTELVRRAGGVPPLSAAANGTGRATNGHRRVVGPKARACRPAARAHPGSRTTCARADLPIDGDVGLNPNERMPTPQPPPPRPPPPANMCTETKWGKMLRLRSSQRGNAAARRTDGPAFALGIGIGTVGGGCGGNTARVLAWAHLPSAASLR